MEDKTGQREQLTATSFFVSDAARGVTDVQVTTGCGGRVGSERGHSAWQSPSRLFIHDT